MTPIPNTEFVWRLIVGEIFPTEVKNPQNITLKKYVEEVEGTRKGLKKKIQHPI